MLKSFSSIKLAASFLAFCLLQFHVATIQASANPATDGAAIASAPQAVAGRLTTRGNQPIQVNGNSATSGATVPTGAMIRTGDGVGAAINLGSLGNVELAPNTQIVLDYSDGQIKIKLVQGCVIVRNKKGTYAEIDTDQGKIASNNPNQKEAATLDTCLPSGANTPVVNQGAAANAGAGTGGGAATGASAGGGLSAGEVTAIIIGVAAAISIPIALLGGSNPSSITP